MKRTVRVGLGCLAVSALFFFCACSHFPWSNKATSSNTRSAEKSKSTSAYRDYSDILIPSGMKEDKDSTFVLKSSGLTAGVLGLKGRVDKESLESFFEINMSKDNWQIVSTFKSPRTLMLFRKDTRWCVIKIYEKAIYTYAEVWVSPTLENSGSGLSGSGLSGSGGGVSESGLFK